LRPFSKKGRVHSIKLLKLSKYLGVSLEQLLDDQEADLRTMKAVVKSIEDQFTEVHTGVYRVKVEKLNNRS